MDENSTQRLRRTELEQCNSIIEPPLVAAYAPAAHVALKMEVYPHWEKGLLKSEFKGRSEESTNVTTNASKCIESKCESINNRPSAPRLSNIVLTTLATRSTGASIQRISSQLYVLSSHHTSPPCSSSLLHLPPATHFPPLTATRHSVLKSTTVSQATTFSFYRLQMLANTSGPRDSTLLRLAGLHNQVQGSPQSPSHWRQAFESESDVKLDGSSSGDPDSDTGGVDLFFELSKASGPACDREDLESIDGWPITEDIEIIELAFNDSFDDPCNPLLSPTLSDSSNIWQSPDRTPAALTPESHSDCTCGHQKHFVHSHAEGGIQSEMSDECTGGSDVASAIITDSLCVNAECTSLEASSMHATAGTASFFEPLDSRTSSVLFLPESDRENDYFNKAVTGANYERTQGDQRGDEDDSNDGHRVYYPIESTQRYSMSGEGPRSLLSLGNFFKTARRRVSSYGSGNSEDDGRSHFRRGRSATVRPLALSSTPCNSEASFVAGPPYEPPPVQYSLPKVPVVHEHTHETPKVRHGRDAQNVSFFRRLSLQLVGAGPATTVQDASPSSFLPSMSDMRSSLIAEEEDPKKQTRKHRLSGRFPFRNLSLATRSRYAHKRKDALERG